MTIGTEMGIGIVAEIIIQHFFEIIFLLFFLIIIWVLYERALSNYQTKKYLKAEQQQQERINAEVEKLEKNPEIIRLRQLNKIREQKEMELEKMRKQKELEENAKKEEGIKKIRDNIRQRAKEFLREHPGKKFSRSQLYQQLETWIEPENREIANVLNETLPNNEGFRVGTNDYTNKKDIWFVFPTPEVVFPEKTAKEIRESLKIRIEDFLRKRPEEKFYRSDIYQQIGIRTESEDKEFSSAYDELSERQHSYEKSKIGFWCEDNYCWFELK